VQARQPCDNGIDLAHGNMFVIDICAIALPC